MRKMIYKDVDPMNYDEFKTELSNSNNIYLVAELENEIVGICFSNIKEISNNKIMKDRKFLHIENICIDKKHQKKGINITKREERVSKKYDNSNCYISSLNIIKCLLCSFRNSVYIP